MGREETAFEIERLARDIYREHYPQGKAWLWLDQETRDSFRLDALKLATESKKFLDNL